MFPMVDESPASCVQHRLLVFGVLVVLRTCAALPKRAVTPAKASSDVVGGILASMDNVARPGDASVGSGGSLSYRNRPCNDSELK